jgi:phage terminase small subunit
MPRKSLAAKAISPPSSLPTRLRPPPTLSASERKIFGDLVTSCSADHFRASDLPILCRYVEAIDLAERAARQLRKNPVLNGKVSPWIVVQEKAVRTIVALSMRLRLSPQARHPTARLGKSSLQPMSYYERAANGNGLYEES